MAEIATGQTSRVLGRLTADPRYRERCTAYVGNPGGVVHNVLVSRDHNVVA